MHNLILNVKRFLVLTTGAFVVFSCSDDADEGNDFDNEGKVTSTELKTILETESVTGATDQLVSELYGSSGKSGKTGKTDEGCYTVSYSETGYTLSFDDCTIEDGGEQLSGSMTVVYGGDDDEYAFSVTYDELRVGKSYVDGTRKFKIYSEEESQSVSWIVDSDLMVTLEDGTEVDEEGTKTMSIVFNDDFSESVLTVDGKWVLKIDGNTYSVDITELLEAQFGCDYIGKGVMALTKNGLEVDVDFGDGDCDAIATVIYPDGTEEEVSLED
ncbi:hypothetical protein [Pseudozobellia thermophila]|uniref:EF-hand domain-containing protein n=1 Tax=Pseudozobellia thermophila TaxID=192903 RepID=A0A1M6EP93_9FLAO|nr:hypothetical protein [Pseudozobellia thermophila]SHI87305.1 hypothetical protein SAMN04488513_102131 [Pseudozobellia thermophila]